MKQSQKELMLRILAGHALPDPTARDLVILRQKGMIDRDHKLTNLGRKLVMRLSSQGMLDAPQPSSTMLNDDDDL